MAYEEFQQTFGKSVILQRKALITTVMLVMDSAFHYIGIVFIAGNADHWCYVPELSGMNLTQQQVKNLSIPLDEVNNQMAHSQCQRYNRNYSLLLSQPADGKQWLAPTSGDGDTIGCDQGWKYDHLQYSSTIVEKWNLVCDKLWLQATASSVYMAGNMAGCLVSGTLSDAYGRKPVIYVATFAVLVTMVGMAFSPNYSVFLVLRFFCAASSVAKYMVSFVLVTEIVKPSWRVCANVLVCYTWAVSYMCVALIAYLIRDWQWLQLACAAATIPSVIALIVITESPRWLFVTGRKEKAYKILTKHIKMNKDIQFESGADDLIPKAEKKSYIWDLIRTKRLRHRSFILFFVWIVNNFMYFGLSLISSTLAGNTYLNVGLSAVIEIPAYLLTHVLLEKFGRRLPISFAMLAGGLALMVTIFIPPDLGWVITTLAMFGKFAVTMSYSILYIFTVELYPTCVRSLALTTCYIVSTLGGILAPYIAMLVTSWTWFPLLVFGGCSTGAGLLVLLLPETRGHALPDTLLEGEHFRK